MLHMPFKETDSSVEMHIEVKRTKENPVAALLSFCKDPSLNDITRYR